MESEFKSFEDYVKYCKDTDNHIIEKLIHVPDTNYMIDHLSTTVNKTFIYNEEEHKCYFYINDKLYKLSVTFEEVEV
jgi:hypothetical protein